MTNNTRKEAEKTFSFYRRSTIAEGYVCRYSTGKEGLKEIDSWRVRRIPGRIPERERSVRSVREDVRITVPGNRRVPEDKREKRCEKSRSRKEDSWRDEEVSLMSDETKKRRMKRVREEDISKGSQVKRKVGASKRVARKRVDRKRTPEVSSSSSSSESSSEDSSSEDSSSEEENIGRKTPAKKSAKKELVVKGSVTMGVLMDIIEEAKKKKKRMSKREILRLCRGPVKKKKSD